MSFFNRGNRYSFFGLIAMLLTGCQSTPINPIKTASHVDIKRFMGPWYVIANIPTFPEKNAYNPIESYTLEEDGTIATTFTFREGSFEGEEKKYQPRGYVLDQKTNAIWGMKFIWPIKADYRIVYVADDYSKTIVGREKRDYVWIMARTPKISDEDYKSLLKMIEEQGYDMSKVKMVPQRWAN